MDEKLERKQQLHSSGAVGGRGHNIYIGRQLRVPPLDNPIKGKIYKCE